MGYPVAYLSGNTTTYETGMFKRGTIGQNQAAALTGEYRWWNGIDVTSSQYLIYSDTYTTSASTAANATPAAWSTPDLTDQSLLALINTLPERVGKLPFTYLPVALQWIQSTGRYFLLKNGYENIVTNGLALNLDAGWYLSYSGTGTNWKDLSSNNLNGSLINGPTFSNINGGSIVFDGVDDRATFESSPNFAFGSGDLTVEVWYQRINRYDPYPRVYQFGTGWNNTQCWALLDGHQTWGSTKFSVHIYAQNGNTSNLLTSNQTVSTDTWYHLVLTRSSNLWSFYINSIVDTTATWAGQPDNGISNTYQLAGAAYGNDDFSNSKIAINRIYNRALSQTEITQNFNAEKTRFGFTADTIVTSGLTINLDAGNVISYPTTGTSWYDISYNNYNASLNNGITFSSLSGGTLILDGIDDSISGDRLIITSGQAESNITYEYWVEPQDVIYNGYTESTSGTQFYRPGSSATKQGLQSNLQYLYTCTGVGGYNNTKVALGFALGTNGFVAGVHQCSYAPTILVDYKSITGTKHLVVIKRANNVSYYLNGVKQKDSLTVPSRTIGDGFGNFANADGSGGQTQSITATNNNSFTTFYKGNIYSYRVYLRELSESEILQNYNAQKSRYGL